MSAELTRLAGRLGRVPSGDFLVAVGGGADSAVAAALVREVSGDAAVRLVHLDHGTSASGILSQAAADLAAALQLPLEVIVLDVPRTGSWEAAARRARRDALRHCRRGAEVIVTGHHRDDVAETLVAHLARGSGSRGLSSLRSASGGYWRPLLTVSRSEIREFADRLGLPYVDDPTNRDVRHSRNRIRHEVLPAMTVLNPRLGDALARSAAHLGEDDAELERAAGQVAVRRDREAWVAPLPLLAVLPPAVRARAVARLVRTARPPYGPSAAELERIGTVIAGEARRTELADGLVCEVEGPLLALYRPATIPPPPSAVALTVPGTVVFGEHTVEARRAAAPVRRAGTVALDAAEAGGTLTVRATDHGERIALRTGSKLVRDALAEAGVPVRKRAGWPVVEVHGTIAWIVGVRVAQWARARPTSTRCVLLSARR